MNELTIETIYSAFIGGILGASIVNFFIYRYQNRKKNVANFKDINRNIDISMRVINNKIHDLRVKDDCVKKALLIISIKDEIIDILITINQLSFIHHRYKYGCIKKLNFFILVIVLIFLLIYFQT